MVDVYNLQASIELDLKRAKQNIEQLQREVEKGVKKGADEGFKKSARRYVERQMGRIAPGTKEMFVGAKAGGILGTITAVGGVLAAFAATVTILKRIHESIEKMLTELKKASPEYKKVTEIMEKMFYLAMKPLGELIATLLRPYLLLQMQAVRKALIEARPYLEAYRRGDITLEQAIEQIKPIVEATIFQLSYLEREAMELVKPIAGFIDGFLDAMGIVFNTWLKGVGSYLAGFMVGLQEVFSGMPDELAYAILEMIKTNPEALYYLPSNVAADFLTWLREHPEEWEKLPQETRDLLVGWLEERPEVLQALPKKTAEWFFEQITMDEEGRQKLQKLSSEFYNYLRGQLGMRRTGKPITTREYLSYAAKRFASIVMAPGVGLMEAAGIPAGGGTYVGDFISRPGGELIKFSPSDTIIGTKGGGLSPTINIHIDKPTIRSDTDIKELVREIGREIEINMRRSASYGVI
ncbi:MAG: hypothetical protein ACE5FT_05545 [Candidatus Nanoarchaeia archaeon]